MQMRYIARILLIVGMLLLPALAAAQTDDPRKKSEIKVGKLDVIYEEEEFKGVVVDQDDEDSTEAYYYQVPFLVNPDEYDEDELPQPFNLGDEGVEARTTYCGRVSTPWPYTCPSWTPRPSASL